MSPLRDGKSLLGFCSHCLRNNWLLLITLWAYAGFYIQSRWAYGDNTLVNSGCCILIEGSNMPCTPEAVHVLRKSNILVAPSMFAGVGEVIAGELELMEFNLNWFSHDFDAKLQEALKQTHQRAIKTATGLGYRKRIRNPEIDHLQSIGAWS